MATGPKPSECSDGNIGESGHDPEPEPPDDEDDPEEDDDEPDVPECVDESSVPPLLTTITGPGSAGAAGCECTTVVFESLEPPELSTGAGFAAGFGAAFTGWTMIGNPWSSYFMLPPVEPCDAGPTQLLYTNWPALYVAAAAANVSATAPTTRSVVSTSAVSSRSFSRKFIRSLSSL
jgi:hypothetical protein